MWHTAAVLVEILQWVEPRLLLVCLEWVTSLKIGMLHGHDAAGPEEEQKNK